MIVSAPAALEGDIMREYEVKIGGIPHTMQLSDEDAQRMGAVEQKDSAPKSRRSNKPGQSGDGS